MTENTAENNNNDTPENESETDNVEHLNTESENDPIALLTKERDDMRDKMMRALADADNTRKQAEKRQADTQKFAISGFAKDMLDIADNLRRALDAVPEDQRQDEAIALIYNGVEATEKIMLSNFEKHGIEKIAPSKGKFDPNFHEVMFEGEVPGKEAGEIIQLLEAGYVLNGRLLRPARVGVAKASGGATEHNIDTSA